MFGLYEHSIESMYKEYKELIDKVIVQYGYSMGCKDSHRLRIHKIEKDIHGELSIIVGIYGDIFSNLRIIYKNDLIYFLNNEKEKIFTEEEINVIKQLLG